MKRDMDLIREILCKVESCEDLSGLGHLPEIDGYSRPQVSYHMELLIDAGLIEADSITEFGSDTHYRAINLTWAGQDFLAATRDESLWNKAKTSVLKPTASYTFDILLEWLKVQVKQNLGLP